jgi:hypothetical protein
LGKERAPNTVLGLLVLRCGVRRLEIFGWREKAHAVLGMQLTQSNLTKLVIVNIIANKK